ncbi:DUF3892 domain-containing protein [Paenibacillus sp. GM2]|uniref:DUF3892 domain-containing protein n=1 Tax=Paenibacillus sp. GM2 TaxID=1622070 RepID=UPI0008398D4E|nr:DUF3892 domain-containing protein [Paenibacillus sp. GM2]
MASHVVAISMSDNSSTSTEHIEKIKLSDGTIETREQAVKYIDSNFEYYCTTSAGSHAVVESVHPTGRAPYIRTKGNSTTKDNLLSLPRF